MESIWNDKRETLDGLGAAASGANADITSLESGDIDFDGNYAMSLQNIPDLVSKGLGYWFDGVDDSVTFGTKWDYSGGLSIISSLWVDFTPSVDNVFYADCTPANTNHRGIGFQLKAGGNLRCVVVYGSSGNYALFITSIASIINGKPNNIVSFTWDGTTDANKAILYSNGKVVGTATAGQPISSVGASTALPVIGSDSTDFGPFTGQISFTRLFNLELTADEVKAFSSGAPVPYKYIEASQTEKMPNQVDRDFSGASAWANVDLNAYDETADLTITANATDQYCTCLVASAPTTIGKRYRMTFDVANIVSTWTIKSFDGTQTIGTVSANGTGTAIEWTATTTGGYRIVAVVNDSSADFDNFTLTQIGCVLQLEQDGIGHGQWNDRSGNELHGTVSGAIPINLPINHREKYIDLAVTGDTSFTLPAGYLITAIVLTSDGAIGGGIDIGITNGGGEIVTAQAIAGAGTVLCTLVAGANYNTTGADDTIYITDADASGWDGATVIVRVQMERVALD